MLTATAATSAALTQLVATGALDAYLTGDSQVTYWKSAFTRCSPFSCDSVVQDFNTPARFGGSGTVHLNRTGDLLYHMYLIIDLPGIALCHSNSPDENVKGRGRACDTCSDGKVNDAWRTRNYGSCEDACTEDPAGGVEIDRTTARTKIDDATWVHWANAVGQLIIKEASLQIGNQTIATLWGELMFCMEELAGKVGRRLLEMVGKRYTREELIVDSQESRVLYTPLPFWFSMASGSALPLASMQFHSVQLSVQFRDLRDLLVVNVPEDNSNSLEVVNCRTKTRLAALDLQVQIMCTYVYLEMDERDNFASTPFESLVVQYQRQTLDMRGTSADTRLNFNHPVIELIWFVRRACNERNGHFFNFSGLEHRDPLQSVELLLNHTVRFGGLPASYYRLVQPYQAHTCIPDTFVYCYSFALHPEDTCTPSGSANFSRIDNINMKFTLQEGLGEENVNVNIYALNWNVIRFKSGMAGLAYAN